MVPNILFFVKENQIMINSKRKKKYDVNEKMRREKER